ncbi:MAG: PAS domain S-box protein, partial [Desulfococcaceae bacterium]
NEKRFRLLFMNAPMPYQSLDEYGNFLEVNEAFIEVLGYSREELIGRNFGDLLDPEWVDHFKENFPRFKAVGEILGVEFKMVKKNGDTILVFFNGRIQKDDQGRFQRTHCILQDITAHKQAEAALRREQAIAETERNRLKAVLEVLPVPVFIADADGRMVSTNIKADETWGEAPLSEQPAQYGEDYKAWWPATGKRVQAHEWGMARAISKGERCIAEEMEIETRDGRRKTILNYALPIRDETGRINGGVAVNVDITDRKQVEEELKRLNESLEQQVWERTALAEARAKQLQALSVELIEAEERERRRFSELLHEDLQQDLASARFQVQAANQSLPSPLPVLTEIEQLLAETIGKSRSLSHELSPAILTHSGLKDALEWLIRHMEEQFELRIDLKSEATQAIESEAVKILLFRAVQELLFNTFKHAGVKTARVILSEFDGCIVVTVSDPGNGFDPELLHSDTVKGGLGLVSLRERIHYIGGTMEIESAPGQGSRFTLAVPVDLKKADESDCDEPTAEAQGSTPAEHTESAESKILRVLFADDHQVMRQGLISLVTDQPGIRLAGEAENGLQALELTRQLQPDVVVMDINMPKMNGIEATRRIKTEMPEVRVIGLSMYEDKAVAVAIEQAGAEAFVNKTASPDELLKAIYGISVKPQSGDETR